MDYNLDELEIIIFHCCNHKELFEVCNVLDEVNSYDKKELDHIRKLVFHKHISLLR